MASADHVRVNPHMFGTAIRLAATMHLLATLPDQPRVLEPFPTLLEYDMSENALRTELALEPTRHKNGVVPVPQGAGMGIEFNRDVLQKYTMGGATAGGGAIMNRKLGIVRRAVAGVALALGARGGALAADDFPVRPIRMIVPFVAGGGTDLLHACWPRVLAKPNVLTFAAACYPMVKPAAFRFIAAPARLPHHVHAPLHKALA